MLLGEILLKRREHMLVDLFDIRQTVDVNKYGFDTFANEKVVKNDIGTIGIDGLKQLKGFVQVFGKAYLGLRIIDLQSVICRRPPFATQQTAQERFFLPITIPSLKNSALSLFFLSMDCSRTKYANNWRTG